MAASGAVGGRVELHGALARSLAWRLTWICGFGRREKFWHALADTEAHSGRQRRDPRLPEAGTTLERQYRGKIICVKVLKDGFEYDGKLHESLSSIASSVTGTRWNGFSFFRLKKDL